MRAAAAQKEDLHRPMNHITPNFDKEKKILDEFGLKGFFTKDDDLIRKYCEIRSKSYIEDNGWQEYNGGYNDFDKVSDIFVVMHKDEVVGGARLFLSTKINKFPTEEMDTIYTYKNLVRMLSLKEECIFGEISGFAIKKDFRNRKVSCIILGKAMEKAISEGCYLILGIAGKSTCRDYGLILRSLGYNYRIAYDIPWLRCEEYGSVQLYPIYSLIEKNLINKN